MIHKPTTYYQEQLKIHEVAVKKLNKSLFKYSMLRLVVFMVAVIAIYLTFQTWQLAIGIAVFGILAFVYFLSKYTDIKYQRNLHKALVQINEDELQISSGDFHERANGLQYQDPTHSYCLDIDLFGKGSFFQFINRTSIKEGTQKLANALKANKISNIKSRQEAIKELADKPEWRQHFSAVATSGL